MAVRDVFKISRKTFFNPKAWLGWSSIKSLNEYFYSFFSSQFKTKTRTGRSETFSEAIQRQGLNEEDLQDIEAAYQAYSWFFLILAFSSLGLSAYLLIHYVSVLGFILGLSVVLLFAAQAFRYDFWFLQVKYRTLGFTFQEWKQRKPNLNKS